MSLTSTISNTTVKAEWSANSWGLVDQLLPDVLALSNGGFGDDRLEGGIGNDTLSGSAGQDRILGGTSVDKINGAAAQDKLTGNAGADVFIFSASAHSGPGAANRDVITDFVHGTDDIDVSVIDAKSGPAGNQAFSFIGTAAFSQEGQIRVIQAGGNTIVQFNTDGASGAEMEITLLSFTANHLAAGDFIL